MIESSTILPARQVDGITRKLKALGLTTDIKRSILLYLSGATLNVFACSTNQCRRRTERVLLGLSTLYTGVEGQINRLTSLFLSAAVEGK